MCIRVEGGGGSRRLRRVRVRRATCEEKGKNQEKSTTLYCRKPSTFTRVLLLLVSAFHRTFWTAQSSTRAPTHHSLARPIFNLSLSTCRTSGAPSCESPIWMGFSSRTELRGLVFRCDWYTWREVCGEEDPHTTCQKELDRSLSKQKLSATYKVTSRLDRTVQESPKLHFMCRSGGGALTRTGSFPCFNSPIMLPFPFGSSALGSTVSLAVPSLSSMPRLHRRPFSSLRKFRIGPFSLHQSLGLLNPSGPCSRLAQYTSLTSNCFNSMCLSYKMPNGGRYGIKWEGEPSKFEKKKKKSGGET